MAFKFVEDRVVATLFGSFSAVSKMAFYHTFIICNDMRYSAICGSYTCITSTINMFLVVLRFISNQVGVFCTLGLFCYSIVFDPSRTLKSVMFQLIETFLIIKMQLLFNALYWPFSCMIFAWLDWNQAMTHEYF